MSATDVDGWLQETEGGSVIFGAVDACLNINCPWETVSISSEVTRDETNSVILVAVNTSLNIDVP